MTTLFEKISTEKRTTLVLSDYIKIKHGYAFKGENFSAIPTTDVLVTPGNFAIGGGFKADKFKYYKGSVPEDYLLKENDLVVTMTDLSVDADTLGYSALIPDYKSKRFLHNQRVGLVQKKKEGIDFAYLYYLMRTRSYQKYVVSTASGSTVKHTSPDRITSFEHDFPSLETQRKIARFLSAFDAMIENNIFCINRLEAIAQTLFDEWFSKLHFPGYKDAEFGENALPTGWEIKKIQDVCVRIQAGGTPRRNNPKFWESGTVDWYTTSELQDNFLFGSKERVTEEAVNETSAKFFDPGTLLMAIYGSPTVGRLGILTKRSSCNQAALGLVEDPTKVSKTYLFYTLMALRARFNSEAVGAAQQNISKIKVAETPCLVADINVIKKFDAIVSPIFEQLKHLQEKNLLLKETRAKLLAKLI